jgi:hypothetical protein
VDIPAFQLKKSAPARIAQIRWISQFKTEEPSFGWKKNQLGPNWRRDLNSVLANAARSFADFPRLPDTGGVATRRRRG